MRIVSGSRLLRTGTGVEVRSSAFGMCDVVKDCCWIGRVQKVMGKLSVETSKSPASVAQASSITR